MAAAVVAWGAEPVWAGMPPPFRLTTVGQLRLEDISFFGGVLFVSAWFIKMIWNGLRGDFPRLPYLSYFKALGLVVLWGLLFVIVLTMISGARELMTPKAWERQGATYQLNQPSPARTRDESDR
jgi:hypothetical protein